MGFGFGFGFGLLRVFVVDVFGIIKKNVVCVGLMDLEFGAYCRFVYL